MLFEIPDSVEENVATITRGKRRSVKVSELGRRVWRVVQTTGFVTNRQPLDCWGFERCEKVLLY
jgi:hypothetical protein